MAVADPKMLIEQLRLLVADPETFSTDETRRVEIRRLGQQAVGTLEGLFETLQPWGSMTNFQCYSRCPLSLLGLDKTVTCSQL